MASQTALTLQERKPLDWLSEFLPRSGFQKVQKNTEIQESVKRQTEPFNGLSSWKKHGP